MINETATRQVWFIAMMAMNQHDPQKPAVGDWVVECSHLIGMPKRQCIGLTCAIGKIISMEKDCYVLELTDGTHKRWENAMMRKLPQPAGS